MPDVKRTTNAAQKELADLSGWLNRIEVSELLGCSVNSIANYERRGMLHSRQVMRRDTRGVERLTHIYDPREVSKIPRRERVLISADKPGEIAAQCFEMLNAGKTMAEILVEIRETPDKIRELREHWLDMGGADLVITPEAKQALEKYVGPFKSIVDLVEMIAAKFPAPQEAA